MCERLIDDENFQLGAKHGAMLRDRDDSTVTLRLTRSQQMALVDILVAYIRTDDAQEFVNVSADTTTTTGELLSLVASVDHVELPKKRG
jgi:hypothetical protein